MWVCSQTINSIPVMYLIILMLQPYSFDYYSFVVIFENEKYTSSNFVLLF